MSGKFSAGFFVNIRLLELLIILASVSVASKSGNPETSVMPADGSIGEQREQDRVCFCLVGGGINGGMGGRHECRNSSYLLSFRAFLKKQRFPA